MTLLRNRWALAEIAATIVLTVLALAFVVFDKKKHLDSNNQTPQTKQMTPVAHPLPVPQQQ